MLGSLFLIKLQAFQSKACKKETLAQVFRSEFCEISKNTFFTEHLLATASVLMKQPHSTDATHSMLLKD